MLSLSRLFSILNIFILFFKNSLKELTKHTDNVTEPNYVFEIQYTDEKNKKFESFKQNNDVAYAFHGSRFENFYSILNIGLLSHFNKVSMLFFHPLFLFN